MTSEELRIGRRGRSRAARIAARTAIKAEINPCPPGQYGGQYRPLSDHGVAQIMETALRILAEIGMADVPHAVLDQALERGASVNALGRLSFSRAFVEDIIADAAKSFLYCGRDSKHDFEIGGERVYFGTGGAAIQTLDIDNGAYRSSTLKDLYDFTRRIDTPETYRTGY